ncbi:hypothetical protein [Proteiniphilum acetatigenes]|uniref:hypothetical protein n=1 Tax=Proteiniphilum acetatigenes TaxID=294710 RepID=UPI000381709A|nr:hypothetical protein [Proteiniphilum acetatigenes]SFL54419.1 hypothetical protein SAMN05216357_12812 [Porphyromonadaceae bacterium KH3CP3RA]
MCRIGKGERSRIAWFLFVHELLNRFESGKISKKEKQPVSLWVPLPEGDLTTSRYQLNPRKTQDRAYWAIFP